MSVHSERWEGREGQTKAATHRKGICTQARDSSAADLQTSNSHPSILPAGVLSFASTLSFCMPELGKCQNPECKLGPNMIEPMLSPKTSTLIYSCRRSVIAKVPVPPTSGQLLQLGRSDCAEFNLLRRGTKDTLWLRSPAQAATACDGLLQDFDCEG